MSGTLNLFERLLSRGRHMQQIGRRTDARMLLERLLAFPAVPAALAAEANRLLGELHLDAHRYCRARRHLKAALQLHADAETHFRLATAYAIDPDADPVCAWKHYRKALLLRPDAPNYLAAFGQLAVRLGRRRAALEALRQAAVLAPNDVGVLDDLADGLAELGRVKEAKAVLQAALFRLPHDARVRRLWNHFRFQQARRRQESGRTKLAVPAGPEPVLLPFVRVVSDRPARRGGSGGVIRRDRFSRPAPHLPRLASWRPDPKHAP